MSFDELKSEVDNMPLEKQNQLAAYLVHLRHLRDPKILQEISARNADRDPSQWISVEQLRQKWSD